MYNYIYQCRIFIYFKIELKRRIHLWKKSLALSPHILCISEILPIHAKLLRNFPRCVFVALSTENFRVFLHNYNISSLGYIAYYKIIHIPWCRNFYYCTFRSTIVLPFLVTNPTRWKHWRHNAVDNERSQPAGLFFRTQKNFR